MQCARNNRSSRTHPQSPRSLLLARRYDWRDYHYSHFVRPWWRLPAPAKRRRHAWAALDAPLRRHGRLWPPNRRGAIHRLARNPLHGDLLLAVGSYR
eukprot:3570294-Pyramimonas_sp.AAC.1